MAKVALGRGLGALITQKAPPAALKPEPAPGERVEDIPVGEIVASPLQPRREFVAGQLEELKLSILEHGILQPLILRRNLAGQKELIAGERRLRAARLAGLSAVPAIIRVVADRDVLELALIENLQRADLNPLEEAEAYQRLAEEFQLRQEEIAQKVGRSRASVANAMRLLDLNETLRGFVVHGQLSVGHAKALLGIDGPEARQMLADQMIRRGLNVRQSEALVQEHRNAEGKAPATPRKSGKISDAGLPPYLRAVENRLREQLATHVVIKSNGTKGAITVEYYGNDDLQRILDSLGVRVE